MPVGHGSWESWRGGPVVGTGRQGGICRKCTSPIKRSYFFETEEVYFMTKADGAKCEIIGHIIKGNKNCCRWRMSGAIWMYGEVWSRFENCLDMQKEQPMPQLSPVLWLLILGNYGVSPKKSNWLLWGRDCTTHTRVPDTRVFAWYPIPGYHAWVPGYQKKSMFWCFWDDFWGKNKKKDFS